jgi:hypothetical protein
MPKEGSHRTWVWGHTIVLQPGQSRRRVETVPGGLRPPTVEASAATLPDPIPVLPNHDGNRFSGRLAQPERSRPQVQTGKSCLPFPRRSPGFPAIF